MDLDAAQPAWNLVVAEAEEPIDGASIVGERLILSYLKDASSMVRTFDLAGREGAPVELGGLGSVGGFSGKPGDPETFYSFSSFNRPATIYRLDAESGETGVFAAPKLVFDPESIAVEQR